MRTDDGSASLADHGSTGRALTMTPQALRFVVRSVEARVRPVRLRLPFRFGAATLTACPQIFVRVRLDDAAGTTGWAAEMMVPRWFDKRPQRSAGRNVEDLALAARQAADAYTGDASATAFGLYQRHQAALAAAGTAAGLTELSTGFGQALVDRAIVDALCRANDVSFFDAARANLFGIGDVADLPGWDWDAWLAAREPLRRVEARHTVGLLDDIDSLAGGDDGLPVSLRAVIRRYGQRSFKIKLGGEPEADLARLRAVLGVLDAEAGAFRYTLDGNEQYADPAALESLLRGLQGLPPPLYLEQPLPREQSFTGVLPEDFGLAFLLDEADGTPDAFARGRRCGWTGVSSKACKGLWKALLNRARCDAWNGDEGYPRYFMSAEDLTCQAGIAVQQDLALVSLLGIPHVERNGHHYGGGFGVAPAAERAAFVQAHGDLYDAAGHLRIVDGRIALGSLFAPGFAHTADPDWSTTEPLEAAASLI